MNPLPVVRAACPLDCPDAGSMHISEGRAAKIQGDRDHPAMCGFLCGKVTKYLARVYLSDRLLPLMRRKSCMPKGSVPSGKHGEVFHECEKIILLRAHWNGSVSAEVAASRLGWNKLSCDAQGANVLTTETLTDLGGGPTLYSTLVEVRRAGAKENSLRPK